MLQVRGLVNDYLADDLKPSTTGGTGSSTVGAETIWTNLLTNARSAGVSLDGRRITSIVADVESSATSTSATATVRAIGARS